MESLITRKDIKELEKRISEMERSIFRDLNGEVFDLEKRLDALEQDNKLLNSLYPRVTALELRFKELEQKINQLKASIR